MREHIKKILLLLLVIRATGTGSSNAAENIRFKDKSCGPRALFAICQLLGVPATVDEISRLAMTDENGTTMFGLQQAAKAKGLETVGMRMSVDKLTKLANLAIVHVDNNHFMVVKSFENEQFQILEPPKEPYFFSKDELGKIWDGNVLFVSKKPSDSILFEEYLYDFGVVEQGQKVTHDYVFWNTGEKDLIINYVRTICGCTAALISEKTIPPDGKGIIKVTYDTSGRNGRTYQTIEVWTNDLDEPVVNLTITGKVRFPKFIYYPTQIYFGELKKGEFPVKRIIILDSEDGNLEIRKVVVSGKFLLVDIKPFIKTFETEPKIERIEQREEANAIKKKGYEIELKLSPDTPIGKIEDKITITTNSEKAPLIEIPVTAVINGPIELWPDKFFFGTVKSGQVVKREIMLTISDSGFNIKKIDSLKGVKIEVHKVKEGKRYELIATLDTGMPLGVLEDTVIVHTDHELQPIIEIPIYALIKE